MLSILKEKLCYKNFEKNNFLKTKPIFLKLTAPEDNFSHLSESLNGLFMSSILHLLPLIYPFLTCEDPDPRRSWIRIQFVSESTTWKAWLQERGGEVSVEERLVADICSLKSSLDTKETNFFLSVLLTGTGQIKKERKKAGIGVIPHFNLTRNELNHFSESFFSLFFPDPRSF